jgi:hypothetical protein
MAKGIYKPEWMGFALSVRQTLSSPYNDKEPIIRSDGTWIYRYFQENPDPSKRDSEYTNKGLMACLREKRPIGVMRQISVKPRVQYKVLGLALVSGWEDGLFYLEGFSSSGQAHPPGAATEIQELEKDELDLAQVAGAFDPSGVTDARKRVIAQIVRRQGQPAFRKKLLEHYCYRCVITGCDAVMALEAAHLTPYLGTETNNIGNGLLLRSDIHTLFDLGLIAIDELSLRVLISPSLYGTQYESLQGERIKIDAPGLAPSSEALRYHREWCGFPISNAGTFAD